MEINKINSVNSIQTVEKKNNVPGTQTAEKVSQDSIELTQEAQTQALYQKAMKIISETPDIRQDKVEAAISKLKQYSNPPDEVLDIVARKILGGLTGDVS